MPKSSAQLDREIAEALTEQRRTKRELADLRKQFEAQGGRGVELAERIDELEAFLDAPLQESRTKKMEWLRGAERRFPVGARVRVVKSDVPEYVGARGTVRNYNLGTTGDWPLISVKFDVPIKTSDGTASHDAFYGDGTSDDEIVKDRGSRKR